MSLNVSVIGLGQVGVSIGLALGAQKGELRRYGLDRLPDVGLKAEKLHAFESVVYRLTEAVQDADVVILTIPFDEVRETLEAIAPLAKPGMVVLDTSPLNIQVFEWAKKSLPEGVSFVHFAPTLNPAVLEQSATGLEAARADLFQNSQVVITCPPGTSGEAFQFASDLAKLLGARPLLSDPWEADGIVAAVELTPRLVSAALAQSAARATSWKEMRKVAGRTFAQVTAPLQEPLEREMAGQIDLANPENVARTLDTLILELQQVRKMVVDKNEEGLRAYLNGATDARKTWLEQRRRGEWEMGREEPLPSANALMGAVMGFTKYRKKK